MAKPGLPEIRAFAEARCRELGTTCIFADTAEADQVSTDAAGVGFRWKGKPWRINLRGAYQLENAVLGLSALEVAGFTDHSCMGIGLKNAVLPGRFQVESLRSRTVVFDVGHNPDAAESFGGALQQKFSGKKICMVTGIMKDKDIAGILAAYGKFADRLILTRPGGSAGRAAVPEELEKIFPIVTGSMGDLSHGPFGN